MLKTGITWPGSFRYQTNSEWEPAGFFSDALCNATSFDLMLGFFSSAAINILSYGFASFIYNGGKVRMIINDILSSDDVNAISMAREGSELPYFDLQNLEELSYTLNKRDKHFFECLSWLIRNERIEIKIIRMVNGNGIAHTKCGIFNDGINTIGFDGSVNFSLSALIHNKESLSVFCDWNGSADIGRIKDIQMSFDRTFNGADENVEFVSSSELKGYVQSKHSKGLEQLLIDELELLENANEQQMSTSIKNALEKTKAKVQKAIEKLQGTQKSEEVEPHFPYPSGPRAYQQIAFENWKKNNQSGLFAMATGTGKTITSLNCLLEIYKRLGYYKALILVPTITLVEQWENECRKFNFNRIIKISSLNHKWYEDIHRLKFEEDNCAPKANVSYIIISTYSSFSKRKIFKELNQFAKHQVLLIADEMHNVGSPSLLKLLPQISYLRRIGLSATPERQFEDRTNKKIECFFGADDGYTYEYSMQEAIKNNVLCKYYYFPHIVELTSDEMEKYIEYSIKISKYYNSLSATFEDKDDILMSLLLARKRIIHKATNKLAIFKQIIAERHREKGNLKYTLVYVPEGTNPDTIHSDIFADAESVLDDEESEHLIDLYTKAVYELDDHITVKKFTGDTKDRETILDNFSKGKLQVLTSMKCLDEGIDVPRSEMAIFCASTGNPRQFIQRRGRILRTHKDKQYAYIHDLVVIPKVGESCASFKMERSLLKNELKRVCDFALLSENVSYAQIQLLDTMEHYGLNLFNNNHII